MRRGIVLLWSALATIALITIGIFGTLVASGRVELFPAPIPTATPTPVVTPVIDTSYSVLILNATPQSGLATQLKDVVVQAGWAADTVSAGEAGSDDFAVTTIYYLSAQDEAAAAGLAEVIGGAEIEQSEVYQPADVARKQLTIVIGVDRTVDPSPTASG